MLHMASLKSLRDELEIDPYKTLPPTTNQQSSKLYQSLTVIDSLDFHVQKL